MDLKKLRAESIAEIVPTLNNLPDEQLAELLALEKAEAQPRKGLLEAIDLETMHRTDAKREADEKAHAAAAAANAKAEDEAKGKTGDAAAKKAASEPIPVTNFRHPDYNGPLDGAQAAWRNANLKPAQGGRTK